MRMLNFSDFDKCTLEPNECRKIIQTQNILRNCWIDKFEVPLPEIDGIEILACFCEDGEYSISQMYYDEADCSWHVYPENIEDMSHCVAWMPFCWPDKDLLAFPSMEPWVTEG